MPKNGDSESVISATSVRLAASNEQNVHSHLRTTNEGDAHNSNKDSPATKSTGRKDEEFVESETNETIGSTGTKRKRVRHRKKKNGNDENQKDTSSGGAGAVGGNFKKDISLAKDTFEKSQSKCNNHVR